MKKILALLCAVFILFGSVPCSAYAAGTTYTSIAISTKKGYIIGERMDTVKFGIYDTSAGKRTDITDQFNITCTYYYGAMKMIALEDEFQRDPDLTEKVEYDFGDGPSLIQANFYALKSSELAEYVFSTNTDWYRYKAKLEITPKSGSFSTSVRVSEAEVDSLAGDKIVVFCDINEASNKIESFEVTASPKGDKVVTITAPEPESGYEYFYAFHAYEAYTGTSIGGSRTPISSKPFGAGKNTADVSINNSYDVSVYKVKSGSSPSEPQTFEAYGFISLRPTGLVWTMTDESELGGNLLSGTGCDKLIGVYTNYPVSAEYYSNEACTYSISLYNAEEGQKIYIKLNFTYVPALKSGTYDPADFGLVIGDTKYVPESVTVNDGTAEFVVVYTAPAKDTGKYKIHIVDRSGKFTISENDKEYEVGENVFIYFDSDPEYMLKSAGYEGDFTLSFYYGNDYIAITPMIPRDITVYIDAREGDYAVFETEDGTVLQGKTYIGKGIELPSFTTADGKVVLGWKCKDPFDDTVFDFGIGETFISTWEGFSTPTEYKLIAILGSAQCDHNALEWKVADEPDQYGFEVHYRKCPYCDFEESHSANNILTPEDDTHHKSVCFTCGLTKIESCDFDHEYCEHIDATYHSCGTKCWCGNRVEDHKEEHVNLQTLEGITEPGKANYWCEKCGTFIAEAPVLRGDLNNDGKINAQDAIYLLRHTLNPSRYPLTQNGDMNGNGTINAQDAIYLLRHTMLPEKYPLAPDKK